ncbi:dicarboxylate/amino acid:cation symporter [Sphingomonas lutea]|uniref:Dicarboxylate/amino acid:cation symporter n=2 Tax=Sphingomonas lutea TaxID=1045317 RepID=A0A7G9SL16_9SPHN|nr:dicarboxylate/amino acid:cation symporter [Sphingomonas lutea]
MAHLLDQGVREGLLAAAAFVGGLWLNALKMTVIPLVVALLVVGIAKSREAAAAGRIASRSVFWIVILCTSSAVFGALMVLLLTSVFPLPRGTAESLQAALGAIEQPDTAALPSILDFFKGIVPSNVIAAASNGDVLPLVVFAVLFALALAKVSAEGRQSVVALFEAVADALLVIIRWVLWVAPIGVFALAFTVGAAAGGEAFAGLGHYILTISAIGVLITLAAYPIAILIGRVRPGLFTRAMIGPQAVAISTRSSLASLPAMLTAARAIGVREQVADVTLPIAVALLRGTGPAMNCAVAFYVAHWLGFEPSLAQMIAATAVAAVMSYGAVSLPGEITFISSIAPIAMALGVPVAPLALFVAVEMIPDIFRTVGNVSLDVAVTTVVDRSTAENDPES